jgi:hypothetical protein
LLEAKLFGEEDVSLFLFTGLPFDLEKELCATFLTLILLRAGGRIVPRFQDLTSDKLGKVRACTANLLLIRIAGVHMTLYVLPFLEQDLTEDQSEVNVTRSCGLDEQLLSVSFWAVTLWVLAGRKCRCSSAFIKS